MKKDRPQPLAVFNDYLSAKFFANRAIKPCEIFRNEDDLFEVHHIGPAQWFIENEIYPANWDEETISEYEDFRKNSR